MCKLNFFLYIHTIVHTKNNNIMGRLKLESIKALDKARARLASLKSIDPKLDLGNGLLLNNYASAIDVYAGALDQYNTALSTVDDLYNKCNSSLTLVNDLSERMLAGVASKYGKKSSEYEMAGGTRKKPS